ncbi:MAG: hypothetical protein KC635_06945, partial [Myxococcales bacterium]|nr:hypothetical protein [Myxococcales bacterium]
AAGCDQDASIAALGDASDAVSDALTDADASGDATSDAASDTASDAMACVYLDVPLIFSCGGAYDIVKYWVDADQRPECPSYYTLGGVRRDTLEALAIADDCDVTCRYQALESVSFVRCQGGRAGYDVYEASGVGCRNPLYATDDGILTDLCTWPDRACHCGE